MSCSGEFVEKEQDLIQIKPNVMKQLKKAKYGVADHSTVAVSYTHLTLPTICSV